MHKLWEGAREAGGLEQGWGQGDWEGVRGAGLLCSEKLCDGGDEAGQTRGQSHGLGRPQAGPASPPSPAHPHTDDTREGGSPQAWACTLGAGVREASRLQGPGQWTEHPETMPSPPGIPGLH